MAMWWWSLHGVDWVTNVTATVAMWAQSMYSATTGSYNVCIGSNTGYNITSWASNIFIGYQAGYRQTTNSNLLIIDNISRADVATELSNSILYWFMATLPADQTLRINALTGIGMTSANPLSVGDWTNYTKFETDWTMVAVWDATVWEDLNFDPDRSWWPVATQPDDVTINNVFHKEFTSLNNQLCWAVQELPHEYKLSSALYPHCHIFLKSWESVGTTGVEFTFYWELRQSTGTTSWSTTLSATSAELWTTAGANKLNIYNSSFAWSAELWAQLAVTIARTGWDAGDIVLTTYWVHYEVDMMWSHTITEK